MLNLQYQELIMKRQSEVQLQDFRLLTNKEGSNSKGEIGRGSYSKVLLGLFNKDQKKYALKVVQKKVIANLQIKKYIKQEIKIQKQLKHPHILNLFFCFEDKQNVYLVLDYAQKGNLFKYLCRKKYFSEAEAFFYFVQTALGLDFIHKHGIIHRDIKPENLLLDKNGNIKISDFGWCSLKGKFSRNTFCGTHEYMAPEILENKNQDQKVDIWSLGVLLYELTQGVPPFKTNSPVEKLKLIKQGLKKSIVNPLSPECQDLINWILKINAQDRPTAEQILRHQFIVKNCNLYNIDIDNLIQKNKQKIKKFKLQGIGDNIENKSPILDSSKKGKKRLKSSLFKNMNTMEQIRKTQLFSTEKSFQEIKDDKKTLQKQTSLNFQDKLNDIIEQIGIQDDQELKQLSEIDENINQCMFSNNPDELVQLANSNILSQRESLLNIPKSDDFNLGSNLSFQKRQTPRFDRITFKKKQVSEDYEKQSLEKINLYSDSETESTKEIDQETCQKQLLHQSLLSQQENCYDQNQQDMSQSQRSKWLKHFDFRKDLEHEILDQDIVYETRDFQQIFEKLKNKKKDLDSYVDRVGNVQQQVQNTKTQQTTCPQHKTQKSFWQTFFEKLSCSNRQLIFQQFMNSRKLVHIVFQKDKICFKSNEIFIEQKKRS